MRALSPIHSYRLDHSGKILNSTKDPCMMLTMAGAKRVVWNKEKDLTREH